jgi:Transcriptional regulatory protein, C terminal
VPPRPPGQGRRCPDVRIGQPADRTDQVRCRRPELQQKFLGSYRFHTRTTSCGEAWIPTRGLVAGGGRVVSVDRLIEDLYADEAPPRALAAVQSYVSHLRRVLEPGRAPRASAEVLVTSPPGYALRLEREAVDAWRFEDQVQASSRPACSACSCSSCGSGPCAGSRSRSAG